MKNIIFLASFLIVTSAMATDNVQIMNSFYRPSNAQTNLDTIIDNTLEIQGSLTIRSMSSDRTILPQSKTSINTGVVTHVKFVQGGLEFAIQNPNHKSLRLKLNIPADVILNTGTASVEAFAKTLAMPNVKITLWTIVNNKNGTLNIELDSHIKAGIDAGLDAELNTESTSTEAVIATNILLIQDYGNQYMGLQGMNIPSIYAEESSN